MQSLTIRRLHSRAVSAPMVRPTRTASGGLPAAPLLLVDVETAEGVTGRAYGLGYTPDVLAAMVGFLDRIAPVLAGQPVAPADVAQLFERKYRLLGRAGLVGLALSVLDMALWDSLGRAAGLPVATLLGCAPRPLPAYDSYGLVDPEKDRDKLEATLKAGFRAIKIKLGAGTAEQEAAEVARIREIVGPSMRIMVDFNQSQTAPEAIRRTRLVEEFDIAWVEEPVPSEDYAGHAEVAAAIAPPVMSGENWWYATEMEKALAAGACQLTMPDVIKIGGITGWMHCVGLAAARGVPISNHCHVEASAHCLPAAPTAGWFEYLDLASAILKDPVEVKDGSVTAKGTGLGIDWDEAVVARHLL